MEKEIKKRQREFCIGVLRSSPKTGDRTGPEGIFGMLGLDRTGPRIQKKNKKNYYIIYV